MTIEYAGRGDAVQTLTLLWRTAERPSRGPKPRLTLDQIVAAGIELADTDGLEALSMRRVAEKLGVGTMTLYRYVPSKGELIDLMLDAATGEDIIQDMSAWTWRSKLETVAREAWALYHRHPWILQVAVARPVLGPQTMCVFEATLRSLAPHGLPYQQVEATLKTIDAFVRGVARESVEAAQAERVTGIPDEKWWADREWFWEHLFDPESYPTLTSYYVSGGMADAPRPHDQTFEFGLQRLLDGFELFVAQAPKPEGDASAAVPYRCDESGS
jgi:AcrR family transcriptional regulator